MDETYSPLTDPTETPTNTPLQDEDENVEMSHALNQKQSEIDAEIERRALSYSREINAPAANQARGAAVVRVAAATIGVGLATGGAVAAGTVGIDAILDNIDNRNAAIEQEIADTQKARIDRENDLDNNKIVIETPSPVEQTSTPTTLPAPEFKDSEE